MNKIEMDILLLLNDNSNYTQRELSVISSYSLGAVNKALKELTKLELIDEELTLTSKGLDLINLNKPKNAIILSAGFGLRMVPINKETLKPFLVVKNQKLIERLIEQLLEVGIKKIYIVVGHQKEKFEYLIDKYGVELIVNRDYLEYNNLHSLNKVIRRISNSYILPSDLYFESNPFRSNELYSWYSFSSKNGLEYQVSINRKNELNRTKNKIGNRMVGLAYFNKDDSIELVNNIKSLVSDHNYDDKFWETAMFLPNKLNVLGKIIDEDDYQEINTYEELREFDPRSSSLRSPIIDEISKAMNIDSIDIKKITPLKTGMTNRSFLFEYNNEKYIMRIPGEGTDKLINRVDEYNVYQVIKDKNICDDIIYINKNNGFKITKFIENSKVCDPFDFVQVSKCMKRLKEFHNLKLKVNHYFDIFEKINYYESLWGNNTSMYEDYETTKKNVFALKEYIDSCDKELVLTHIDAVPDNFLFSTIDGKERINLIDWEYASLQDPQVDIAMFAIYALYDKEEVDRLIDIYFEDKCDIKTRIKIYAYVASCGLLWSNWCEYKAQLGVEFGEYSLRQYRFAKDFYRYAKELMKEIGE